jgi:hypothetical protein
MGVTEAEVKLCEEKHKNVDRRLGVLEEDKRNRDAAGWKMFGIVLMSLLAAALSFIQTFVPKGVTH